MEAKTAFSLVRERVCLCVCPSNGGERDAVRLAASCGQQCIMQCTLIHLSKQHHTKSTDMT